MRTIQESPAPHNAETAVDRPDPVVIVLTTWPDDPAAASVARQLVEARHAACVTRLPRHAVVYRWHDAIEESEEQQWVIKTTARALEGLWAAVRAVHPYDTPEWIVLAAAGGSDAYLQWVRESTAPAGPSAAPGPS
jgi:periplasmic divalent cation tolerance protein